MKKKLLAFPFPLVIVIAYVFIGVLSHVWHPTWLIFLLIPAYYEIVSKLDDKKKDESSAYEILKAIPLTSIVIIVYLAIGFILRLWHPTWLLFLLIPLYYSIIPLFKSDKKSGNSGDAQNGTQNIAPNFDPNGNAGFNPNGEQNVQYNYYTAPTEQPPVSNSGESSVYQNENN